MLGFARLKRYRLLAWLWKPFPQPMSRRASGVAVVFSAVPAGVFTFSRESPPFLAATSSR
jgi:hypothetical protein